MAHTHLFRKLQHTFREVLVKNYSLQTKKVWTRRRFLKMSTLMTGSAIATTSLHRLPLILSQTNPKIAVVGGGIAGLNAAYQLKKIGLIAQVYEAKATVGGRIRSVKDALGQDLVLDLGGFFVNQEHEDILSLAAEFNLSLFNRRETIQSLDLPSAAYYFNGRFYPESEVAKELATFAQQVTQDAALLEEDFNKYSPIIDQFSVKEYLEQHADKISEPFIRSLIEATIRTEYGVELEQSSALQLIYNLPTVTGEDVDVLAGSDETYVIRGGSGRLIASLATKLTGQIQTGKRLLEIKPQGKGYQLIFADRSQIVTDYVIIAIPFTVLRNVAIKLKLPANLKRFIQEVDLGNNEKVFVGFQERFWQRKTGFTGALWTDLSFAEAWDDTLGQNQASATALTLFFGGQPSQKIKKIKSSVFFDTIEQIFPHSKQAANHKLLRTQWSSDSLVQGGYTNFKPGQYSQFSEYMYIESTDAREKQDVYVDNLIFAGEHLSDEYYGYMNGAAQTGRLAAQVLVNKLEN